MGNNFPEIVLLINFTKTTAPQQVMFEMKLYTIIIFKDTGHYLWLSSHLVYLNILCTKQRTSENLSSIGRRSSDIILEEKTPCLMKLCAFRCLISRPQNNSKSEVSKSNSQKITSFSKTTSLQREPFLTVFYTITSPHNSLPSKVQV